MKLSEQLKYRVVLIGLLLVSVLVGAGLVWASLSIQKWVHSPVCHCDCGAP